MDRKRVGIETGKEDAMDEQRGPKAPQLCQGGQVVPSREHLEVTKERDRYRAALREITDVAGGNHPTPHLLAAYLRNIALIALQDHAGQPDSGESRHRSIRIRHHQLHLEKNPDRTISSVDVLVRMGDLVALMICAEYMKRHEHCRIVFQLMDETHKSLKADVLFRNTLDEVLTEEGPNCGLQNPKLPEIYDPGPLWIASTFYHGRFGGAILPKLNLDPDHYHGPKMDWGRYVVFHPLFDPPYNKPRGMEESFVNAFCDKLYKTLGERALVITDRPERIHSSIRVVTSRSLYDLVYLIGRAQVYLGGDTGFTHMAAVGRVSHLFALYGKDYGCDFPTAFANLCFDKLVNPFADWGKYWGTGMDTRPKCDSTETTMHFHLLEDNQLPLEAMDAIVQQIRSVLNA